MLTDQDLSIDFSQFTTPNDCITVLVTIPITANETWQQLAVNECLIFQHGKKIFQDTPPHAVTLTIAEGIAIARKAGVTV